MNWPSFLGLNTKKVKTNFRGPEADALADRLLLGSGETENSALAIQNYKTSTIDPFEAVTRIKNTVEAIASSGNSSLALKAYAIALQAQAEVLPILNSNPLLISRVYFEEAFNLPSYNSMLADLVYYCQKLEPESTLKAVLDSFSGWSVLGIQKFEDCRCSGDPVNLELKIRAHHSHEIRDGKFFIEQFLGVESENKLHLEKHYSGFSRKSVAAEDSIQIVSISRASIQLQGEYGHILPNSYEFAVEEERCSEEIDINTWQQLLESLTIQGQPLDSQNQGGFTHEYTA